MELNVSFAQTFSELSSIVNEIENLNSVYSLLIWDQSTYLPENGFPARGKQMAVVGKIIHEKLTNPKIGELLDKLNSHSKDIYENAYARRYIELVGRNYYKAIKIPANFVEQMIEHQSVCYDVWVKAKETNNFKLVEPYLEKTLHLSKEYSNFFDYKHIADPLIEQSDYGFDTFHIKKIFNELKSELVPFVKQVIDTSKEKSSLLQQKFAVPMQEKFSHNVLTKMGFDFTRGRLDKTIHPFMIALGHGDVRITTRYDENNFTDSLFSTIHEMGHAFYEQGVNKDFDGSPLFGGISSAVHESQSRLWENIVGRSYEFWEYFYPALVEYFPTQFNGITLSEFYAEINRVEPSLIRTESDELTYNLHVLIRFQLELDLLENNIKIKDLPEAWNTLYKENLGITVPTDALGCLQDVHWYGGMLGGQFQGYTLGNIMSAQFFAAAKDAHPTLAKEIQVGRFGTLKAWLTDNLYQHGKMFDSLDILKMATKSNLTIAPYMNYLKNKFPIKNLT